MFHLDRRLVIMRVSLDKALGAAPADLFRNPSRVNLMLPSPRDF